VISISCPTLSFALSFITGFLPPLEGGSYRGNFGLMDQVAALHWVQENIAEFGGDSSNVTLVGQGYGATCANHLMVSPMVRGKLIPILVDIVYCIW